ncbi:MAG: thiamine pyrophosphate-requiring protein [Nocardioidaceae bacterium]
MAQSAKAADVAVAPTSLSTVADDLVTQLAERGVDVVFLNPGTDTAPVQEAVAKLRATGVDVPRIVLCPHEAVALAAAHAYFAVTGRPQVVMVHVDVGTQNLGAMLHNAFRAEAAVVVIAGRTPITAHGELPGGRDHVVHWQQDVPDQAGVVRSYTKGVADLERPETLARQLNRAFQLAGSTPPGPVYLTASRELLMADRPTDVRRPASHRYGVPAPMAPDPVALREAARLLADGRRPVITTTRVGRHPAAVAELVDLAELVGAVVIDRRERVNFPSTHPAYLADPDASRAALASADVVVVVDSVVPWVPLLGEPSDEAAIITMDTDPVRSSVPGWSFPSDVTLQAHPTSGLRLLCAELRAREAAQPSALWEERREYVRALADQRSTSTEPEGDSMPVPSAIAVRALDAVLSDDDVLVEEATTNAEVLRQGLRRTLPATLFHPGGSGLGWGLGGALGAKLAAPDRRVVAVVGDGSFLFSNPSAALWAARAAKAPFLTVVFQNGGYAASRRPVFDLYPDGYSAAANDVVGTRLDDPPDFALLARACGAAGETVAEPSGLVPALERGLAAVAAGSCAVVVLPVRSPWFSQPEAAWSS